MRPDRIAAFYITLHTCLFGLADCNKDNPFLPVKTRDSLSQTIGEDKSVGPVSSKKVSGQGNQAAVDGANSFTNSIGAKLVLIPSGEFEMGGDRNADEQPVHKVKISKPFYLGATEVTQTQWQAVMGTTPWKENVENQRFANHKGEHAASELSWDDAVEFCEKLRAREGRKYRLPTEAEWEYACRAGSKTKYSFGNDESALGDYAWFFVNTWDVDELYAHAVGQKEPNAFGVFDMHGNVCEWCQDYYKSDYYKTTPLADPANIEIDIYRVLRGGSWVSHAEPCRSAIRSYDDQPDRNDRYGFRVVCELE